MRYIWLVAIILLVGCSIEVVEEKQIEIPITEEIQKEDSVQETSPEPEVILPFTLTSPVFTEDDFIPEVFSCMGKDVNPQLDIQNIPKDTKSLALIMDDPDVPDGMWVHWVVWNIPIVDNIPENFVQGVQGKNTRGVNQYDGPCPTPESHRYFFKLYAIYILLDLPENTNKEGLENAMEGHILEQTELMGKFTGE